MLITNKSIFASAIISAILSLVLITSPLNIRPSFAGDAFCITEKGVKRMLSGRWNKFKFRDRGRIRTGKSKFLQNGKMIVVTDSGMVHKKGTWKRKGNTIYRYAPTRPSGKRFKYTIRRSCKSKEIIF